MKEVKELQNLCSRGKAVTFDAFSDTWLKTTRRLDLISNWWRPSAIEKLKGCFAARLIPLNKVWPNIPSGEQFRPIAVLSPAFKWLELRFLPRLRTYLTRDLDRN
jgi:hypothetical protein